MVNLLENSGLRYKIIAKQLVNFMGVLVIASMMGLGFYYNFYYIFFEVCIKMIILFWAMALGVLGAFTFVCHAPL